MSVARVSTFYFRGGGGGLLGVRGQGRVFEAATPLSAFNKAASFRGLVAAALQVALAMWSLADSLCLYDAALYVWKSRRGKRALLVDEV